MKSIVAISLLACCGAMAVAPTWPLCTVRTNGAGGPAIHVGNTPYAPLFFACDNQGAPEDKTLNALRQAAEAEIPLFSFNVPLAWDMTDAQAAELVDTFCRANPSGYFSVEINLDPSKTWMDEHPGECVVQRIEEAGQPARFQHVASVSPGSTAWRETVARMLQDRVCQIATGPHGGHFIGVELGYKRQDSENRFDYSAANQAAFQAWLERTYKSDKALQKAWHDVDASLDSAPVPALEPNKMKGWGPFSDPVANRRIIDFRQFQREITADTVAYFAQIVKVATARRSLVGARNDIPVTERLLACKDIDILWSRRSEVSEEDAETFSFQGPVDSLALHGKLFVVEDTAHAPLSNPASPSDAREAAMRNPQYMLTNPLSTAYRTLGFAMTHRGGMAFRNPASSPLDIQFWKTMALFRRLEAEMRSEPSFAPQVAFVMSGQPASLLQSDDASGMDQTLSRWRTELDRIGAPVACYLQSDLPNLPTSIRLLVLADAFVIDKVQRRAIDKYFERGITVVWNYAPDVIGPEGIDAQRISDITGIAIEVRSGDAPATLSSALTDEELPVEPIDGRLHFVVVDKQIDVVARYKDTGDTAAAARPIRNGVSLYTAVPVLPVGLMRTICARAGVHLYRNTPGATGVAGHYLFIDTEHEGAHTFQWPYTCRTVERIVPPSRAAIAADADHRWSDVLSPHTTALYACYAD